MHVLIVPVQATISDRLVQKAMRQLRKDGVLAPLIEQFGPCTLRPHKNYYRELTESIIGQQLSVKAAVSINRKFVALFGGRFPEPSEILKHSDDELRSAGLSGAKVKYVRDLAHHILDGKLEFEKFDVLSNDEIIAEVLSVKGIGEWTAHMFLMFCMARPDVLPVGDHGIKNGIRKLYNLDHLPSPDETRMIAKNGNWHPYESIASWYIWQSLDNMPAI